MEDMRLTDEEISDAYCDTEIKSKNYKDFADYMFARVVAVADSQIAKVLRLLVEKAGETPQLVKTEPVDFGDLDSFFERGAEAQLEADNAHYRPIIGALKAEIERLQVKVEKLNGMLLTKDEVVCITSDECNGCPTFENNQLS